MCVEVFMTVLIVVGALLWKREMAFADVFETGTESFWGDNEAWK